MVQYKKINIKTVGKCLSGSDSGFLSFFEANRDIPFDIKRVYFISGVKKGGVRGFHAHKRLKQLLFCPFGSIKLKLEDENGTSQLVLDKPSIGIIIDHPVWREIEWQMDDSVLCVAASDFYDENDYIRDYNSFKSFIGSNVVSAK